MRFRVRCLVRIARSRRPAAKCPSDQVSIPEPLVPCTIRRIPVKRAVAPADSFRSRLWAGLFLLESINCMSQPTPARQIRPIRSCLGTSPTAMRDNIRDRAGTMGRFSQARHRPRTPHRPPASRTVRPPPPAPTGPISEVDPADAASGVGGAVGRERGHQAVGGGDHAIAIAGPCRYALSSVVGLHRTMPGSPPGPGRRASSRVVPQEETGGPPHPLRIRVDSAASLVVAGRNTALRLLRPSGFPLPLRLAAQGRRSGTRGARSVPATARSPTGSSSAFPSRVRTASLPRERTTGNGRDA